MDLDFKVSLEKIAKLCLPLFRLAFATGIEPIQFKGGVIIDLLKSAGFHLDCCASRDISFSNILCKIYRKAIRKRTLPELQDSALSTMCGGISHLACEFVPHILHASLDLSRMREKSILTFFVDAIAAFDSVLHSLIVGLELSDESIIYLMNRFNFHLSFFLVVVTPSDLFRPDVKLGSPNTFVLLLLISLRTLGSLLRITFSHVPLTAAPSKVILLVIFFSMFLCPSSSNP